MKSLVTGATGFIGSHLAEMLKQQGHEVRLLVRSESRLLPETRDGCEIVKGDVTGTPEELKRAVQGCDYVYHVAGLIKGRTQREFNHVNAIGTRNLCEAAKRAGGLKRLLLVSSQSAIGPSEDSRHVVTEDTTPHPVTYYGRSKLLAELFAREFMADVPITIVRPPTVYGPRDTATLEFFKWMSRGYSIQFGNQEKVFSIIHGLDLCRGIIEAAQHEATVGDAFFVANDEPAPMSWVMELLRDILKPGRNKMMKAPVWLAKGFARMNDALQVITRRTLIPNSDKMRDLMPQFWVCSAEKARRVFGWSPRISLRDGLAETAEWYIKQGWIRVR